VRAHGEVLRLSVAARGLHLPWEVIMFRIPIITALLVGTLIAASDAQADTVTIQATLGGLMFSASGPTSASLGPVSINGVEINSVNANSNIPGTASNTFLTGSALLTNSSASSATIALTITATDLTLPTTAPLTATDFITGGLNVLASSTVASTSANGTFNGSVSSNNLPTITIPNTTATATQTNPTAIGPFNTSLLIASSLTAPFSMTETLSFTLAPGAEVNLVGFDTTLGPAPVPLPATLPLFATGLGALGLLGWRRKRKAQAVA
jgi:hypothetical protein